MVGIHYRYGRSEFSVKSNTLKPLTNAQTVCGRPTSKQENERAFRKGSFRELLANISNLTSSKEIS